MQRSGSAEASEVTYCHLQKTKAEGSVCLTQRQLHGRRHCEDAALSGCFTEIRRRHDVLRIRKDEFQLSEVQLSFSIQEEDIQKIDSIGSALYTYFSAHTPNRTVIIASLGGLYQLHIKETSGVSLIFNYC